MARKATIVDSQPVQEDAIDSVEVEAEQNLEDQLPTDDRDNEFAGVPIPPPVISAPLVAQPSVPRTMPPAARQVAGPQQSAAQAFINRRRQMAQQQQVAVPGQRVLRQAAAPVLLAAAGEDPAVTAILDAGMAFAQAIMQYTPSGPDQSAAIRKVREACWTAAAAVNNQGNPSAFP